MDQPISHNGDAARDNHSFGTPLMQHDGPKSTEPAFENGINSSPPILSREHSIKVDPIAEIQDDFEMKSDSEAETIVHLEKTVNSPSKAHKTNNYENKSVQDDLENTQDFEFFDRKGRERVLGYNRLESKQATSSLGKRKRPKQLDSNKTLHINSRGLNSAPISPVAISRSPLSKLAASDSENSRSPSPRPRSYTLIQDKARSVDHVLPRKININQVRSVDNGDGEARQFVRQQSPSAERKLMRDLHVSSDQNIDERAQKSPQLASPNSWGHKRSSSNQLPTKNSRNLCLKKRRAHLPPLSTDYHSDESSASGNSRPQGSRMRNTISSMPRDSISSAKMGPPHKKHVNCSGQTPLAVACARGKLELVQKRYEERPQDINVADNALNTPLHIASLEGWTDIVKFLLETGHCELDCINTVKDTPLHDAIDNQNTEVVKLLLDAGANPSKPNQAGNDPLDLLNQQDNVKDKEVAEIILEMKEAVMDAREKYAAGGRCRSEEINTNDKGILDELNPKSSPRQISPTQNNDPQNLGLINRKVGTARSLMKTTERVLYQTFDLDALRVAARDGDIATASRVLDVRPGLNDAQTLYNAAKGGHDAVINLLFALGDFEPDPEPIDDFPPECSTPILAAIGKENHLEVIKLFLGNTRFNPARRIRGETYFEIATRRGGPKWQEETDLLREAFEAYQKKKSFAIAKSRSPGSRRHKRTSEIDVQKNGPEDYQMPRLYKQTSNSKLKDWELSKGQHRRRISISQTRDGSNSSKKNQWKQKKRDESPVTLSEPEASSIAPPKIKSQYRNPDFGFYVVSEHEPVARPRRKLVSRKELKDGRELEKQRRSSISSTTPISETQNKKKSDRLQSDTKSDKPKGNFVYTDAQLSQGPNYLFINRQESKFGRQIPDKEKYRPDWRNELKDRQSSIQVESLLKRPRKSETPPSTGTSEFSTANHESERKLKKRKKVDSDKQSSHKTDMESSSPEQRTTPKSHPTQESLSRKDDDSFDIQGNEYRKIKRSKSPVVFKDSVLNDMALSSDASSKKLMPSDHVFKLQDIDEAPPSLSNQTINDQDEIWDQLNIKCEKLSPKIAKKKVKDEQKETMPNEEKAPAYLVPENEIREGPEKHKVEGERQQGFQDVKVQKRIDKEQELCYQEQERLMREEQDRKKAIILEQQRMHSLRLEQEQREQREQRLSKLPLLLKWFYQTPEPKTTEIAKLFSYIVGFRYDTINTKATGQQGGDDQWMLSTHAAILLGEKDLQLSRYKAWERVALTNSQKRGVWNSCNGFFLLLDGNLPFLRKQLPCDLQPMHEIIEKNKKQFMELDLFFVKVTEFMYVVPNFPHLRGIEMAVLYRELRVPQNIESLDTPHTKMKWHQDVKSSPVHNLTPLPKYYTNGVLTSRAKDSITRVLKKPPQPDMYPRRMGLTRVYPGDSDYEEICRNRKSCKLKVSSSTLQDPLPQTDKTSSVSFK